MHRSFLMEFRNGKRATDNGQRASILHQFPFPLWKMDNNIDGTAAKWQHFNCLKLKSHKFEQRFRNRDRKSTEMRTMRVQLLKYDFN